MSRKTTPLVPKRSRLPVAPHDCTGPLVYLASLHFSIHAPNALVQESVRAFYTGWYRELVTHVPQPVNGSLAKVEFANALMFTLRGQPVVYYGDEQGFIGDGGDKDARQDMFPSQVASYNDDDLIGTDATTAVANFDMNEASFNVSSLLEDGLAQCACT